MSIVVAGYSINIVPLSWRTVGANGYTSGAEVAMTVGDVAILADQLVWASERPPHDGVSPATCAIGSRTLNG